MLGVVGLVLSACGAEPDPSAALPQVDERPAPAIERPQPETAPEAAPAIERPQPSVAAVPAQQALDQPAIWPAADVVFATPEEAAADFVAAVLISEGDPVLGEFQAGDARSGEIAVLFAGESGDLDPPLESGILLLRQIGPTDGWYVIAATSDGVVIDAPSAGSEVAAGPVTVSGQGRGFEGTLVVSAFPPGSDADPLDLQIGAGGALGDLEPYSVDLDLSGAAPGDVVVILVRGDTGLGSDPSTFAAIPIVIASAPSPSLPPTK